MDINCGITETFQEPKRSLIRISPGTILFGSRPAGRPTIQYLAIITTRVTVSHHWRLIWTFEVPLCGCGDSAGLGDRPQEPMAQHLLTMVIVRESPPCREPPLIVLPEGSIFMHSSRDTWVDHKCLIYWQSGLNHTQQHNITYSADSDRVLLESFEVLRVVGGTRYEGLEPLTAGLPRSRISTSTTTGTLSPTSDSNWTDIRVLVPAITGSMIVVFVILCFLIRFAARRKRKREEEVTVVAHDQVPTYTPASIQPPTSPAPPPVYLDPPVPTRDSSGYYSAPVTSPAASTQQPHDDQTVEEVKRLRQEVDAMMAVIHEQQNHQRNQGEDGGHVPPPEHQPTAPSEPNSSPPPGESSTAPQVEGGS